MTKYALLSVSDKTGITELASCLVEHGYTILSTGGTQKALEEAKIPVTPVEDLTHFPECLSGRVKTLHPLIAGGILYRRDDPEHEAQIEEHGIKPIDLVAVTLYPFEKAIESGETSRDKLIELIDIGGPTLLRSAAKNHKHVTVLCDTADYSRVIEQMNSDGNVSLELRQELAAKTFLRTAAYDSIIAQVLSENENRGLVLEHNKSLRYGENPHQWGAYFASYGKELHWEVLQEGKPISYLNILDADGAWNLINEFSDPAAACIKHANPSGVAVHNNIEEAFQRSYDADRLSAFGVIIALNKPCTAGIIERIVDQKIFTEVIIAPEYEDEAIKLLESKPKIRVIKCNHDFRSGQHIRSALGGYLIQEGDSHNLSAEDVRSVTDTKPTDDQLSDMLFAWRVVKHAKSNAIVFAKNNATVGIGCGQTSRVDSTIIAARRAGERAQGAVMASDAFFPFPDSVEEAAKHGICAIVQPGGSIRDEEVIAKANELNIPMIFTGVRGFRH